MAIQLEIPGGLVQLSGNPIWVKLSGANPPVGATNYKLALKLISDDGLITGAPFTDGYFPDANGQALADISGIVDIPIRPVFEFPGIGAVKANPAAVINISFEYGETYVLNGEPVTNLVAYEVPMRILKGGVSDQDAMTYLQPFHSFFNDWINAGKFLTNQPNNQKVSPDQVSKLWWMTPRDDEFDARWYCRAWLNHEANQITWYSDIHITPASGLLEFNVNPVFLGLNAVYNTIDFGPYVRSFEFWIEDPAIEGPDKKISEVRTYVVDRTPHENNTYLLFLNSKRGIDMLWLTGAVKTNFETTGAEAQRPVQITDTVQDASVLVTNKSAQRKWTINTGYKSAAEILAMQDLLLSKSVWLVSGSGPQFWNDTPLTEIPVRIANADKLLSDTMEDLNALELELIEARNIKFA